MYKNQFDKDTTLYKAYMFWGSCDYLVDEYSKNTALKLANGEEIRKVYFDEYSYKDAVDFLSQSSLFSPVNILFIKISKKIPKKDIDNLISICNTNPDSYIIFSCIGDADFKSMSRSFTSKNLACQVVFYPPYDNEAIAILQEEVKKKGIIVSDQNTLSYLYTMHEKDLSLCVNDLNKLAILNKPIGLDEVNAQCFGMGSIDIDKFFINLFSKINIGSDIKKLLEEGINEIYLINQTTSFIQQLFNINSYIKLNGRFDIKDIWGYNLPSNIANDRKNIALKYTLEQINNMMNYFLELELELKTKNTLDTNSYTQAKFRNFSAILR